MFPQKIIPFSTMKLYIFQPKDHFVFSVFKVVNQCASFDSEKCWNKQSQNYFTTTFSHKKSPK